MTAYMFSVLPGFFNGQQLTGAAESNVAQAFKANLMHCTWIGSQNIEFWIEVFHLLFSELGFILKMVKIFVGNLTDECTNEDLQTLFSQYEIIAKSKSIMSRSGC